jgi:hypothetical protein
MILRIELTQMPEWNPLVKLTQISTVLLLGILVFSAVHLVNPIAPVSASDGLAHDIDGDGWTSERGDCDDTDKLVYPGASEIPDDGIDQDCDGFVDELDTDDDGDGVPTERDNCPDIANRDQGDLDDDGFGDACDSDADGDGFDAERDGGGDCDDTDPTVHPGAREITNGVDDDCDSTTYSTGELLRLLGVPDGKSPHGGGASHSKGTVKFFNESKGFGF